MRKLYESDKDFKEYVDRYMIKHGVSFEYALTVKIVISYGEFLKGKA